MKFIKKLWATVHEPKFVAVLMVIIYLLSLVMGVSAFNGLPSTVGDSAAIKIICAVLLTVGAVVGVFSAWRGLKWAEGLGEIATIFGLIIVLGVEVQETLDGREFFFAPIQSLVLILFMLIRLHSLWPYIRDPALNLPSSRNGGS